MMQEGFESLLQCEVYEVHFVAYIDSIHRKVYVHEEDEERESSKNTTSSINTSSNSLSSSSETSSSLNMNKAVYLVRSMKDDIVSYYEWELVKDSSPQSRFNQSTFYVQEIFFFQYRTHTHTPKVILSS
jgi:hypothetical protein